MKMEEMIRSFPNQINEQFNNLKSETFDLNLFKDIKSIVIAGMGGSAISGDLVRILTKNKISIPITVIRDYSIPLWSNEDTLFILSSYSGNTEETMSCFDAALSKSKKLIAICTGGKLQEKSINNNVRVISIPKGYQPRAALGYSLITLLSILNKLQVLESDYLDSVINASNKLDSFYDEFCKRDSLAYTIAQKLKGSMIAIYGVESSTDHIAGRLRAQIAENAKMLATYNVLPEMNHNEIEAWNKTQFSNMKKIAIWISDKDDHPRVLQRIKITSELLEEIDVENIFITCDGDNYPERCLKLLFLNDWVSYYLAEINNTDPVPVDRIMNLKNKLS
jgi:glucose/mannose-6-phosphate isomerase